MVGNIGCAVEWQEDDHMVEKSVRSAGGGVAVVTTERGLPVRMKIDARELTRDAADLAREILLLCRVSATRQQVARRRGLESGGVDSSVADRLGLASEAELETAEAALYGDSEQLPDTWLKQP
jgi:hypothetical protein